MKAGLFILVFIFIVENSFCKSLVVNSHNDYLFLLQFSDPEFYNDDPESISNIETNFSESNAKTIYYDFRNVETTFLIKMMVKKVCIYT